MRLAIVSDVGLGYTGLMMRNLQAVIIGMAVFAAGCAPPVVPESLAPQIDQALTFNQMVESPDTYRGKVVVLGGEILKAKALKGGTQLEILQLPLDSDQEPVTDRMESKGRFLALQKEFLDPATIAEGTRVTVIGEVTGSTVDKMDEADYRFPTLDVKHLHRWDAKRAEQRSAPGPWWNVFGGVGFGGGATRSGGGISIGF
ncbi:MAG: Slp family lipoprotein [Nitrospira sp.]|nr:Slp family lipoprotein [Nitrospira sp.]